MRPIRLITASVIVIGGIWAIYATCWVPLRCNRIKWLTERSTVAAFEQRTWRAARTARSNLAQLRPCLNAICRDVPAYMIAAVNERLLDHPGEAIQLYQAALRLDRRPELYLNLGNTLIEAGQSKRAVEPLVQAVMFNPYTIQDITDGTVRKRVQQVAVERQPFLAAYFSSANQAVVAGQQP